MPGGRHFWPDRWSKEEKRKKKKKEKKRKPKKCLSGNNLKIAKIELVIYKYISIYYITYKI